MSPFCPTPPPSCNTPSASPILSSSGDSLRRRGRSCSQAGARVRGAGLNFGGKLRGQRLPRQPAQPRTPQRRANHRRHPPAAVMSSGVRGESPAYFQLRSRARRRRPRGRKRGRGEQRREHVLIREQGLRVSQKRRSPNPRGSLRFLPPLEMRPSSVAPDPAGVWECAAGPMLCVPNYMHLECVSSLS